MSWNVSPSRIVKEELRRDGELHLPTVAFAVYLLNLITIKNKQKTGKLVQIHSLLQLGFLSAILMINLFASANLKFARRERALNGELSEGRTSLRNSKELRLFGVVVGLSESSGVEWGPDYH